MILKPHQLSNSSLKNSNFFLFYGQNEGHKNEAVQQILEIGFNAGHSSELFLINNPQSTITSIDLGYWYYCKFGSEYLKKQYPGRINVIFKDSLSALKDFNTVPNGSIFDLIYIDGNHTYEYAYNDLKNCRKFANKDTVVLLDDVVVEDKYRTLSNTAPTKVWKEFVSEEFIFQIEIKHFKDINRGIAIGKYIF